ncbi:hypothetical protein [Cytobacillus spongiae]|jgi:hypothetical protein|nr:hypothetical protein [Cytobacillus spongiae]
MPKEQMSKKIAQAIEHANETNPSSRSGTAPHTSKKPKVKGQK